MTKPAALNVFLTPELVAFVAAQVGSGRYGSASEVVCTNLPPAGGAKAGMTTFSVLIGATAPVVPDAR